MIDFGIAASTLESLQPHDAGFTESAGVFAVEAALQGAPLNLVISQIEAVCQPAEPSYEVLKAVSLAWSDVAAAQAMGSGCVDPLTDMASAAHLRDRLEGLYRRGARDSVSVSTSHRLLVIETRHPYENQLDSALAAVDISNALRSVFVRDEIVAALTPRRFVVLAESARVTDDTLAVVAVLMRRVAGIPAPLVRAENLPPAAAELTDFLVALSS